MQYRQDHYKSYRGPTWIRDYVVPPNGIANILSLKKVKEKYHVTYDSWDGNKFTVSLPYGCLEESNYIGKYCR